MVTLLTDFGQQDEYVGVMKGVILRVNPAVQLVDLCHEIPPGDLERAGRLLNWSWRYFPDGTVHVAVVDPGVGSERKILCVERDGHRFLAPDNGILSWVLQGAGRVRVRWVRQKRYFLPQISHTFHGRDILAPVAGHLSMGLPPVRLGPILHSYARLSPDPAYHWEGTRLQGRILQWDRFGNAVTSIPAHEIERLKPTSRLEVWVRGRPVNGLRRFYAEGKPGSPLALIGSRGLLEMAVHRGSVRRRLNLRIGDRVEVRRR